MYHTIYKSLFGKQESQESIQESRNQVKNQKIPESRRRKSRVADPSRYVELDYRSHDNLIKWIAI